MTVQDTENNEATLENIFSIINETADLSAPLHCYKRATSGSHWIQDPDELLFSVGDFAVMYFKGESKKFEYYTPSNYTIHWGFTSIAIMFPGKKWSSCRKQLKALLEKLDAAEPSRVLSRNEQVYDFQVREQAFGDRMLINSDALNWSGEVESRIIGINTPEGLIKMEENEARECFDQICS